MIKEEMWDFWIKYLKHCDLFYHIYTKMSRRIKFYIFIDEEKMRNNSISSDHINDFFKMIEKKIDL